MTERDVADEIVESLNRLRGRRTARWDRGRASHDGERFGRGLHGHGGGRGHGGGGDGVRGFRMGGPASMRLLTVLTRAGEPLGVGEIGEAIGVDQPRASRLVAQGVELGLVRREADPDDARRTRIALTEQGRAAANRFSGAQRERVAVALEAFSDEERERFSELLARFATAWSRE